MIPRLAILTVGSGTLVYWNGKAVRGDVTGFTLSVKCTESGPKRTLSLEVDKAGTPISIAQDTDFYKTVEGLKDSDFSNGDLEVTVNGKAEPIFTNSACGDD